MKQSESWKASLRELGFADPARYAIVESWTRSRQTLKERNQNPEFKKVSDIELEERLEAMEELIEVAAPKISQLLRILPGSTNVGYLTDKDGIVLFSAGREDQIADFKLSPGYDWSEATMGTNGAGTALARRSAIAVVGEEHFLTAFENCTCTASPIFGPDRSIIGAIDFSSSVADAEPERLAEVIRVALEIEQELYANWNRSMRR